MSDVTKEEMLQAILVARSLVLLSRMSENDAMKTDDALQAVSDSISASPVDIDALAEETYSEIFFREGTIEGAKDIIKAALIKAHGRT